MIIMRGGVMKKGDGNEVKDVKILYFHKCVKEVAI
jgi:hypothetical protein